ncbi:metallophosphoesterase [Geomicrobium sp. JSM 1781026]|uniref:metallophosphoesterase family protein n=1 Tax=Geomicrobium sp. JSM 1781026 TaxID=3344580 RepID=UPI0035C24723
MRLAVFGDSHGNAVALEKVAQDILHQSPDAVICLGDIVFRGPQPSECIEIVESLNPLITIGGNVEDLFSWFPYPGWVPKNMKQQISMRAIEYDRTFLSIDEINWLTQLPTHETFDFNDTQTEVFHATPTSIHDIVYPWASLDELDRLSTSNKTNLSLFGHVHHSFVRNSSNGMIVNPGSAGFSFDRDNRASYALIDIEKNQCNVQIRRIEYDIDKVIHIAKERNMPDVQALEHALRLAVYPYHGINS